MLPAVWPGVLSAQTISLAAATVDPEKVDNYEVGLKTQFLDRRITLNLAGYWTEIGDYQATVMPVNFKKQNGQAAKVTFTVP